MMKYILPVLLILSVCFVNAQDLPNSVKVRYPDFVPDKADISYSYIFSGRRTDADSVRVNIIPSEKINLTAIKYRAGKIRKELAFRPANDKNYWEDYYTILIDDSLLLKKKAFQILADIERLDCSELIINTEVIRYYKDGKTVKSSSYYDENETGYIRTVFIAPYITQKAAGKALKIIQGAGYTPSREPSYYNNNMLIEFWAKFENFEGNFLRLFNNNNGKDLLEFGLNEYGLLKTATYVEPGDEDDFYISNSVWYHFDIFIRQDDYLLDLYINDHLVFSVPLENYKRNNGIQFSFYNKDEENAIIFLDQLNILDFNNSIETAFVNKNYSGIFPDSSKTLLSLSFDREVTDYSINNNLYYENELEYTSSDAPLFSRAPELNVSAMGSFYNLEWTCTDVKSAVSFYVEKSTDGRVYETVYSLDMSMDEEKVYFYSDTKNTSDELVYYRIRQENTDGSIVYSPQVKIGQGNIDQFAVEQNYPNPFNPVTTISVELFEAAEVEITVYDITGKKIDKLHSGFLSEGQYRFQFDGSELPSGIYMYEIKTPYSKEVQKMILAK